MNNIINTNELTEEQLEAIGIELARLLSLKRCHGYGKHEKARYTTTHGDKTHLGLARTILDLYRPKA